MGKHYLRLHKLAKPLKMSMICNIGPGCDFSALLVI